MFEDGDVRDGEEFDDDDDDDDENVGYCPACSGSGEGQHEGTRCLVCHGRGE